MSTLFCCCWAWHCHKATLRFYFSSVITLASNCIKMKAQKICLLKNKKSVAFFISKCIALNIFHLSTHSNFIIQQIFYISLITLVKLNLQNTLNYFYQAFPHWKNLLNNIISTIYWGKHFNCSILKKNNIFWEKKFSLPDFKAVNKFVLLINEKFLTPSNCICHHHHHHHHSKFSHLIMAIEFSL